MFLQHIFFLLNGFAAEGPIGFMVLQFFLYLCKYNVKIRKIAINIARKNIKILRCVGNKMDCAADHAGRGGHI